jgi:Mrp family chromosome partitioning ATPase
MFKRSKTAQSVNPEQAEGLALQVTSDSPAYVFPPHVVDSLRHMTSWLMRDKPMSASTALIATLPEEGVTYSTLALATTLAHDLPGKICVVELNWYRPGMKTILGELNSPGLAGLFTDNASLQQLIVTTTTPNLSLIPAGDLPAQQRTIVARSSKLHDTIDELSKSFNYVVLDIPAITLASDAIPLATLAGDCLLVIRQGVTPLSEVKHALADMDHLHILGVILNKTHYDLPKRLHGLAQTR